MQIELTPDEAKFLRWLMSKLRRAVYNESGRVVININDPSIPTKAVQPFQFHKKLTEILSEEYLKEKL